MLSMRALENLLGIGIQVDVGEFADAHRVEIILVNIADNPDVGKIGDREGVRSPQVPVRPTHLSLADR